MKHITTWRPDTCDCVVSYEWDDSVPAEKRQHRGIKTNRSQVCSHHRTAKFGVSGSGVLKDAHKHYEQINAENKHKNSVINRMMEEFKLSVEDINFSFDKDRKLSVSSRKLTTDQRKTLVGWLK